MGRIEFQRSTTAKMSQEASVYIDFQSCSQLFGGLEIGTRDVVFWNVKSVFPTQIPYVKRARGRWWGILRLCIFNILFKL